MCELDYDEIEEMIYEGGMGICTKCCSLQSGVEPDAEGYICENCGEATVMGIENAVVMMELEPK